METHHIQSLDISLDEDVENNYQQDHVPDILNPYLGISKPIQTYQMVNEVVYMSPICVRARPVRKNLSLKNRPTLTISTN
ncbi:hypothetical protein AKO1_007693 [Acrasis kona]|uniref:Uncharacterized protein n=1 Tax=Acrasis kona TaxID=1008807 RepID=A0AAW2YR59_9EUKA